MKKMKSIIALLMALLLSACALAEAPQVGRRMMSAGRIFVDESQLTPDQLAAYQQVKANYEAIEDNELANLVAAGTVTQQEVDEYQQTRNEPRQFQNGAEPRERQRIQMNDEQRDAIAAAMQSEDREQAMADLIAQDIITQDDADAMANMPQSGQMELWGKVQAVMETDTVAQIAVNNIQVAAQMMQQALQDAGIALPTRGRPDDGEEQAPN